MKMKTIGKRALAGLLSILLVVGCCMTVGLPNNRVFAVELVSENEISDATLETDVTFEGGDGTEENPYQVATAEQLNAVRNNLSAYYIQTADIDLSGVEWEPIGNQRYVTEGNLHTPEDVEFSGSFDGRGHKILNLTLRNNTDSWLNYGLFGYSKGIIQNIRIENLDININGGDSNWTHKIGGIVGYSTGNINNCIVSGNITIENAFQGFIGGIAGQATNCQNSISYVKICIVGENRGSYGNYGEIASGGIVGLSNGNGELKS